MVALKISEFCTFPAIHLVSTGGKLARGGTKQLGITALGDFALH